MTARFSAIAIGAVAIVLVLAQDVDPSTALYHTWQYALALTIAIVVLLAYANDVRRGKHGPRGRRLLLAVAGALLVAFGGLASGLLGPDTAEVTGTPGTVVPIPAIGAAAFFAPADAGVIARGAGTITLRRRDGAAITLAGAARRPFGESLLYLVPHAAAYVEPFDERGARLTVTQPANAAFLSPVLFFPQRQRIGAFDVPLDTFAAPARHRVVRALYFTPAQLAQFGHANVPRDPTRPALVLSAGDDTGRSLGIALAESGQTVALAGIRVRVTIGSYPALAIAAAPPPWVLGIGIAAFLAGLAWSALRSG
ncbi:MAG TPA: hypothetical protein VHT53_09125 [Candidatus Elarobacter sp.]|nr:hypothetical protein [Candidatus Elarobacter sp.]